MLTGALEIRWHARPGGFFFDPRASGRLAGLQNLRLWAESQGEQTAQVGGRVPTHCPHISMFLSLSPPPPAPPVGEQAAQVAGSRHGQVDAARGHQERGDHEPERRLQLRRRPLGARHQAEAMEGPSSYSLGVVRAALAVQLLCWSVELREWQLWQWWRLRCSS